MYSPTCGVASRTTAMLKKKAKQPTKMARSAKKEKQVMIPAAITKISRGGLPAFGGSGRTVSVSHRELVGTLSNNSVTGFSVVPLSLLVPGYDLNPGSSIMFPWLSQMAKSFERYRFTKLVFHFVPGVASSTNGRFYAGVDYDYDDTPLSDKAYIVSNPASVDTAVWAACDIVCDPRELHRDMAWKYVSSSSRMNAVEPRTAFCGFLVAAFDTPTANLSIDLFVEYEVEFAIPERVSFVGMDTYTSDTSSMDPVFDKLSTSTTRNAICKIPLASTAGGPIRTVLPGIGNVPVFKYPDVFAYTGVMPFVSTAWDVSQTLREGLMTMVNKVNVPGATAASMMGWKLYNRCGVYDSLGTYKGDVNEAPNGLRNMSVAEATDPTATETIYGTNTFWLKDLFAQFPSARYLVPYLSAVVGATVSVGSALASFKYEL